VLFEARFGTTAIGALPLALALVPLAALVGVRRLGPAVRTAATAWCGAAVLGLVSAAVALQLDHEWLTIAWALEGALVIVLWSRLGHPGLKWFGLALLLLATARLAIHPAIIGVVPRPGWRVVNWLLPLYLVPAACLLGAATILRSRETTRAGTWERDHVYAAGVPIGAVACGLAGLAMIFLWINVAIADWLAIGPTLTLAADRLPARDLVTSLAWILYALGLLAIAVARDVPPLRWASLGLTTFTIGKVFLHDLGELRDLYRVASLLGLALSLILVSLVYQRFVFRVARTPKES
jgi:uncharacterized membrane protein